jgi:hypothetical protein
MGHFGNKNGSWVWAWLGLWKEHCLFGVSSQRGFAQESLGEPSNFQVVASGSQQLFMSNCVANAKLQSSSFFQFTLGKHNKSKYLYFNGKFKVIQILYWLNAQIILLFWLFQSTLCASSHYLCLQENWNKLTWHLGYFDRLSMKTFWPTTR